MSFLTGFLLGRVVAERQGITDDATVNKLALMGAVMGGTTTGLVMTTVLAQREAEAIKPLPTASQAIQVEIPDVTDETFNEAKKRLESLGLVIAKQELYSLNTSKGHIISQNPVGGTIVPQQSQVTLAISLGADVPSHCPPQKNHLVSAGTSEKK